MKHVAVGLLIAGLAGGCATAAANIDQVRAGMNRDEVMSLIGQPEASSHAPGQECTYHALMKDFWSRTPWTMTNRYYVCYVDGKVDSFGRTAGPVTASSG